MIKIWNWIVGEVRTAETIISKFTDTVKELEQHIAQHLNIREDLQAELTTVEAEYQHVRDQIDGEYHAVTAEINADIAAAEAEAAKAEAYAKSLKAVFPTI